MEGSQHSRSGRILSMLCLPSTEFSDPSTAGRVRIQNLSGASALYIHLYTILEPLAFQWDTS